MEGNVSKFKWMMTVLLALSMIAAACGDDDDADEAASDSASTVEEENEDSAGEEPAEQEEAVEEEPVVEVETNELVAAFDANGDGTITIGVAAAGPRDDNGYYQSLVNFAENFSADNGFAPPIVSDNIGPAEAAQAMSDLAQQGVDATALDPMALDLAAGPGGPEDDGTYVGTEDLESFLEREEQPARERMRLVLAARDEQGEAIKLRVNVPLEQESPAMQRGAVWRGTQRGVALH